MTTVLLLAETKEGKIKVGSLEAASAAKNVAIKISADLQAVVLGSADEKEMSQLGVHGVSLVHHFSHQALNSATSEAHMAALIPLLEKIRPSYILAVSNEYSRDLLPRVTARMGGAMVTDVTMIEVSSPTEAKITRPVYAGKANVECRVMGTPITLLTKPKAFTAQESAPGTSAKIEEVSVAINTSGSRSKVKEVKATESKKQVDLTEADIIVSGGRGLGDPKNFYLVEELAAVLGARVGASRAVVDAGWRPHTDQVGQTGKIVSPKLYIAIGISGAIQHKVGAIGAKVIVAINNNPDAPIFKFADYGIVGDVFQIVPLLKEELKKVLGKG